MGGSGVVRVRFAVVGASLSAAVVLVGCSSAITGAAVPESGGSGADASTAPTSKSSSGGSGKGSVQEWVDTFCAGSAPVFELSGEFFVAANKLPSKDYAALKSTMIGYFQQVAPELEDLGEELDALGAPSGSTTALHEEAVEYFRSTAGFVRKAMTGMAPLDPADPAFATKLNKVEGGKEANPGLAVKLANKLAADPAFKPAFTASSDCEAMNRVLTEYASVLKG